MIIQWLDTLIGELPAYYSGSSTYTGYYAIVRYIIAGVILIFLVSAFYRLLVAIFGRWVR